MNEHPNSDSDVFSNRLQPKAEETINSYIMHGEPRGCGGRLPYTAPDQRTGHRDEFWRRNSLEENGAHKVNNMAGVEWQNPVDKRYNYIRLDLACMNT